METEAYRPARVDFGDVAVRRVMIVDPLWLIRAFSRHPSNGIFQCVEVYLFSAPPDLGTKV